LTVALTGTFANAADWGDLSLQLTLDGAAPAAKKLDINKDVPVCTMSGSKTHVDESLLVDKDSKGIANVVVVLYLKPGSAKPAIHADYDKSAKDEVILDNKVCAFEPRVLAMRSTQTLLLKNSDTVAHNTNVSTLNNPQFNPIIPANGQMKVSLTAEERLLVPVSCSIHPWMQGRLIVRETPYFAVSDKEGKISIKNLPTGKHTFQVMHEKCGFIQEAKKDGKAVKWAKGRIDDVEIKKGANDLGKFTVPVSVFKDK
jgi:plastocyanin